MTKKSAVYTRSGDKGETSLVSGSRLAKDDFRIELYGDVDELNSHLGHGISLLAPAKIMNDDFYMLMSQVQSSLFDLGSQLACESEHWEKFQLPQIETSLINDLEKNIDLMDEELPKLKSFILPGGSQAASYFHIVRTVCRRVERKLVHFSNDGHALPQNSLSLLNRLSDYFFVLGRYINFKMSIAEVLWQAKKD